MSFTITIDVTPFVGVVDYIAPAMTVGLLGLAAGVSKWLSSEPPINTDQVCDQARHQAKQNLEAATERVFRGRRAINHHILGQVSQGVPYQAALRQLREEGVDRALKEVVREYRGALKNYNALATEPLASRFDDEGFEAGQGARMRRIWEGAMGLRVQLMLAEEPRNSRIFYPRVRARLGARLMCCSAQ